MPPNEFDLRAALRDGEGDGLDPERLIDQGRTRLAQRRSRLLNGAAVVAVVVGAAVAATQLGASSGGESGGSSNGGAGAAMGQSALGAGDAAHPPRAYGRAPNSTAPVNGGAVPAATGKSGAVACPATAPNYLLPGGGSPGQFGAGGPLFGKPVSTVLVCGYPTSARPAALALSDGDAERLVTSMENAPMSPSAGPCGQGATTPFVFVGLAGSGKRVDTVTADLGAVGCAPRITNGTAVRFDWIPPADVKRRLFGLVTG